MLGNFSEIKNGKIEHNSSIHFAIAHSELKTFFQDQNHKNFEFESCLFVDKEDMMKVIIETKPEMIEVRDQNDDKPLNYASRIGKFFH